MDYSQLSLHELQELLRDLCDEEYELDCDNGAPRSLRRQIAAVQREINHRKPNE